MKNTATLAILTVVIVALTLSCIGQKELTVEEWKGYLTFMNPRIDQSAVNMVFELPNVENLPTGTHAVFEIECEGSLGKLDMPSSMIMEFTITGKEIINGIECTVVNVAMEMEGFAESVFLTFEGREWVDKTGAPVRVEGTATGKSGEFTVPMTYTVERTGEEAYHGHECWIFSITQKMQMGQSAEEVKIVRYMDKESYVVVRVINEIWGEKVDTGYIEPLISTGELEWVLEGREKITTNLGDYDCQLIYLMENDVVIGTIWANEEIRAPVKYVFSYETEYVGLEVTMILVEYSLGE